MASDLLLEIGTEELPASFILPALEDLRRAITERLETARLAHGTSRTFGTPRRLAVLVEQVAESTTDASREVIGPSAKAAFDAEGKPTQAAEKFAASNKVPLASLRRVQTGRGEYVAARIDEKGRPASTLLPELLSVSLHGLVFRKSMRWSDVEQTFARPVHWVLALLGGQVVPLVFADVRSDRATRGHRFLAAEPIELRRPGDYEAALEKAHVIADFQRRRSMVEERVGAAAARLPGASVLVDPDLLDQVTNLTEAPHPVLGSFDDRYLDLPREVLVQEMKSHQRYFALADSSGRLLPRFVAVSNTPVRDERVSRAGYERVLRARLADARFFFDEDRKVPLAERVEALRRVVWQGALGSYAEKVERIRALSARLCEMTGKASSAALLRTIDRAAFLSKADLVTGMVGEFPELQGVMGREYALAAGESREVALAIFEHYLPRGAGDALATSDAGALIGIADRLDTLTGIFGIGKSPTGAADPYALRRACLGVINIILARQYRLSLSAAINQSLTLLQPRLAEQKRKSPERPVDAQLLEFFRGRLKVLWGETFRPDVVEAILSAGFDDLIGAYRRLEAVSQFVLRADFGPIALAFKRVANIVDKQAKDVSGRVDSALLKEGAERELYGALQQAEQAVRRDGRSGDYAAALRVLAGLKPAVDAFFDKVMVMTDDKALRANRISVLRQVRALFNELADFSKVQSEGSE